MKKNKNQFGGILAFPLLLVLGIGLLWWNEGNYVKTASAIKEAQADYVTIKDAKVEEKNEKKVIVASGTITTRAKAVDEEFKISELTPILARTVEMYQWDERCDEDNHCSYSKKWSKSEIRSDSFKKSGYTNPSMPYKSETFYSSDVGLGDFNLSNNNLSYLNTDSTYKLEEKDAENNDMKLLNDNRLYKGKNIEKPEVGDIVVSFAKFSSDKVTCLGVQEGNNITKFVGKSGKAIMYTMEGIHSGDEVFKKLVDNNKTFTWIMRLVGCVLLICAISSIFSPIRALTDRVPILGGIVGALSGFFALLVGLALSIIVIAIAWFAYRPVASIIAILVVVAIVLLYIKFKNNKNVKTEEAK